MLKPLTSPRTIFAVAGKARSGKNTVGDYIANNYQFEHPVCFTAFADKLKFAALQLNPIVGVNHFGEIMRLKDAVELYGPEDVKDKVPEVRQFLQRVGTEGGWMIHGPELWINHVVDTINALPDGAPVIITDVCFPTEIAWAKSVGAHIIEIVRSDNAEMAEGASKHISEAIVIEDPSCRIVNDASLDDLYACVDKYMMGAGYAKR